MGSGACARLYASLMYSQLASSMLEAVHGCCHVLISQSASHLLVERSKPRWDMNRYTRLHDANTECYTYLCSTLIPQDLSVLLRWCHAWIADKQCHEFLANLHFRLQPYCTNTSTCTTVDMASTSCCILLIAYTCMYVHVHT